ncbi:MAG: efflux RND transporter periplasmic adaptor subunit [Clostridiales bacterium]|nr:efflux RND transporter periplasmic adaptor subunit [Clostridiales bacterium]
MKLKLFLAASLCCCVLSGCGASAADGALDGAQIEKPIMVEITTAEKKEIKKELPYPGQVKAAEQIPIMGKLSGKVDQVFFKTGDAVRAGDVLYTIDLSDIEDSIKSLEAQVAAADAAIRSARTGVDLAGGSQTQSQILQASGGVQQAETAVKQAESSVEQSKLAISQRELALDQAQTAYDSTFKSYNDSKTLYESAAISRTQFEQTETALKNAEIGVEQARSALEQSKQAYDSAATAASQAQNSYNQAVESQKITDLAPGESARRARDSLAQATAQKNSLLVNLESARAKVTDASITSPIDGVISSRNIEPGTMISPSAAAFTIVRADIIEARVNVTETLVNGLAVGQKFPVYISAVRSEPFTGEIVTLSPSANEATSTFEVRLSVDNKENLIKPGMYAEVIFVRERAENAVVIPRGAIVVENDRNYVYVMENDNASKKIEVNTGVDNGSEVEILTGVEPGTSVIIRGQAYLRDGSLVKIDSDRSNGA